MNKEMKTASPVKTGIEDKFYYEIGEGCAMCGTCADECPAKAITDEGDTFRIDPAKCIDCGTCSVVCPLGIPHRTPQLRESISVGDIDFGKCYFNPGCALSLYKPDVAEKMHSLLLNHFGDVKLHTTCCRHDPKLPAGSTIINNCAGCDRRFRSLYHGIRTISYWEVIDGIPDLPLPDHTGLTVSVHDSCGYRHKPQVHRAVRNLLRKMNVRIVESDFSGTESVCCGDNYYGLVPNEQVEQRMRMRASQLPCQNVVVYCIGCVRAMQTGGKTPCYLPDLLFANAAPPMTDTLDEYHTRLEGYISEH